MKKLLICIIFLLVSVSANGFMLVNSRPPASATSECASFYNATNVVLSWDGDHSSGTNYICNSSGTGISGTNTNLTVSTSYGESSSNGSFHDSRDERITWSQTAKQYFDETGAQTLWMRIYITANPDQDLPIFEFAYDTNNYIVIYVSTISQVIAICRGTTLGAPSAYGVAPSLATWVDIAYSWDRPNQDHAMNTSSWEEDLDELTSVIDNSPTSFSLGNDIVYQSSTASTNAVYVTQWALVSGYKAAKPW